MMTRDDHRRAAAFVDRDGTLIYERGDLGDPDGVELIPGAADALARLKAAGLPVILVTNQSGIARGLFSEEDFGAVQRRLVDLLAAEGVELDAVYYCPHHPDVDGPCDCRKPAPGMYLRARDELGLDLASSFYVGDRWRDVAVTEEVGGTPFLIETGAGGAGAPEGIEKVRDLGEAVEGMLASLENRELNRG
ncbi:MAG: HAD family hydrolase [Gemmatimonadetes bacterium]|uniref:D,D-heptose 1,7-bisphosphate phosphatase n=1 Tax=Candidatus Kutchimonas denitrificans TaxID=3056748 RepID=A0AAE5CDN7_9BACT|nr:HAD family hydrolase [Gemmatimonadota bacterium]NIR76169.1 HAD family hydrolase [Candidatus Kutchimonas denitrificans]NIS00609.1 HAD family hydrolase [Gemmatimonadota bacterium]NIT66754.1 HAD family hydrolase [Gemmatimonadota bacterium]NIV23353.1 HAD-IIIA family hydrolase [Gemmatimonadota bacterium]